MMASGKLRMMASHEQGCIMIANTGYITEATFVLRCQVVSHVSGDQERDEKGMVPGAARATTVAEAGVRFDEPCNCGSVTTVVT